MPRTPHAGWARSSSLGRRPAGRLLPRLLAGLGCLLCTACLERAAAQATPWRPSQPPELNAGPALAASAASAASAATWRFELLRRDDGPQIHYADSLLSAGSSLICHSSDWQSVHYKLARDAVRSERQPGRLAISSDPAAPTAFTLETLRLEATGAQTLRLTADGRLDADVEARIEYLPLCLPASLLLGAELETDLGDHLVVGAAPLALPRPVRSLRLNRPGGSLVLSVVEGPGLTILDRREKPYHNRQVFLFLAGDFTDQPRLAKGGRFRHVLDLALPEGFRSGVELPAIRPTAQPSALAAQPAELPARSLTLCPQPRSVVFGAGRCPLPAELVIDATELGEGERLAAIFADALAANGCARPVRSGAGGWIRLRRLAAPAPGRWDYHRLSVGGEGVEVAAASPAAASYALGTLAQLLEADAVRQVEVEDWADFRYRSLHIPAGGVESLLVQSNVIRHLLVPLRFNQIVLECKYVHWPSQPAIHHRRGMPYADFKALVAFAEARFLTAIPLLATYGHSEYLFQNQANLDLAEDPAMPYAYDVSNPRTWEVMRGLLGDVRAAAPTAPWIHLGHDEVTMSGRYPQRPANLGRSLGELLAVDLAFYQAWAASHGTALMLWSDYLAGRSQPEPAVRAGLQAVIGSLDPSAVVAMWEYDPATGYAECEPFLSRGVTVFGATGEEDVRNITSFARYAKARNLPGMMHTSWTGYTEALLSIYRWPRKLWPYVQAGLSFWNAEAPLLDRQAPSRATAMYDRMIGGIYPAVRRIASGDRVQPIDLGPVAGASLAEPGGFTAGPLRTPLGGYFVLAPAAGGVVLGQGGSLRIPLGRPARALSLLWAGLGSDPSVHEVGRLAIAGARPSTTPILVRRELGNLRHGLVTQTDTASGAWLTRADAEQNFSLARPVFPPSGQHVLWQYDLDLGGAAVEAVTITASSPAGLVIAGVSVIE